MLSSSKNGRNLFGFYFLLVDFASINCQLRRWCEYVGRVTRPKKKVFYLKR